MLESDPQSQNDELIQKLTQIVLENLSNEQFGVSDLAARVGMNRSHLYRKVLQLSKKSVSQFIREIRLSEALKILKEERVTVSEVAYRVGFKNPSYFNSCFHDYFGFPPGEAKHVNLKNSPQYKKRKNSSDIHRFSFTKKNAFIAIIFFLVLVSMATVLFLKRNKDSVEDKSIAVLPFYNDSSDQENEYFINGTMEAILDHLCKIKDLRVVGRTSVEQYRNNPIPVSKIAKELNVRYLLEGSGQKYGNKIHLNLQLLDAVNEKHLWSSPYSLEIELEEIFKMQSEIAQLVAEEIRAIITPEEKQLIEKVPTSSLTAYYFYQKGREEQIEYWLDDANKAALDRAEDLYYKALEYDSTFAQAYIGLASVYWSKYYWKTYLTEEFLDSAMTLANLALSYDPQLSEAYVIRGNYYKRHNQDEQAVKEYDMAIKFNPNDWEAYYGKGWLYFSDDYVKHIDNIQKAASLQRGPFLPGIYRDLGIAYAHAGFKEKAIFYVTEAFKLDDDSAKYFCFLGEIEDCNGNFGRSIEFLEKSYAIDSTDRWVIRLIAQGYMYNDQSEKSLEYWKKYVKRLKTLEIPVDGIRAFLIGYTYQVNGFNEEAEYYNNTGLEIQNELIKLDRLYNIYSLAAIYASRGDKDKAYEYLRLFNQRQRMPLYMVKNYKNNPLFDSIRDEPEFQHFLQDVIAKYEAEHERVRQWLEENDVVIQWHST